MTYKHAIGKNQDIEGFIFLIPISITNGVINNILCISIGIFWT